jgi:uncharacterized BrkB/YihY/UPF0761 family membrane protein
MANPVPLSAHLIDLLVIGGIVIVVGVLSAVVAIIANRCRPRRSEAQLTTFTIFTLAVVFFVLTLGLMLFLMTAPCTESPCDAGAMAAAGTIMLGGLILVAVVLIGGPIAYFTIRALRRR